MLTTLPQRVRASLAPTHHQQQQSQPSSSSLASSTPSTVRLSTRANVTAASFLPRASVASAFAGSLLQSPLESNLNCVYGLSVGGGASELVVRSLLTPGQVAHLTEQAALAAQADNEESIGVVAMAIDPAPIQATLTLRNTGEIHAIECLSDRLVVVAGASGDATMIELQSENSGGGGGRNFFHTPKSTSAAASASTASLRASHTFSLSSHALTGLSSSLTSATPLLAACSEDGSFSLVQPFTRTVLRRVEAHPSALACIEFAGASTIYTAGQGGTITGWDVRAMAAANPAAGGHKPVTVLADPHAVSITALALHPTRPYNLAAASSNGTLSIFDVRAGGRPLCSIQAQRSAAWDLAFLPWAPNTLASVSEDGSLCAFDFAPPTDERTAGGLATAAAADDIFTKESVETRMVPRKLAQHTAGLNAIDVDRDTRTILAAADGHGLIVVNNA